MFMQLTMPERYNFAAQVDEWANRHPDKPAVWEVANDGQETIVSYGELRRFSNRIANGLQSLGISRGTRFSCSFREARKRTGCTLGCSSWGQ
jgi:acetyl-CoA synthetase